MTTKKVKDPIVEEANQIRQQLTELQEKFSKLVSGEDTSQKETSFRQDDYIKVMNLTTSSLNLSTRPPGQGGTVKHFDKFGEIKNILYGDLIDITERHSDFLKAGYFYILNPDVVRFHGWDELYETLLTDAQIKQIISLDGEQYLDLFKSAGEAQKEVIVQMLIDKVRNEPDSTNLNLVSQVSSIANVDILEKARDSNKLKEILVDETKQLENDRNK